jgi:nitroreductase
LDVAGAIRTRRTHKAYGPEPVDRETLDELFELARWAPNHHLTNPWRFRVLGPRTLARLKEVAGPEGATKLDRAPTLVLVSAVGNEEDRDATAAAAYIVLLAAHARGLASYWRTPEVVQTREGRTALGIPDEEQILGLIHLGPPRQEQRVPERAPTSEVVAYLE